MVYAVEIGLFERKFGYGDVERCWDYQSYLKSRMDLFDAGLIFIMIVLAALKLHYTDH